jgi:hypothetical protein
MTKINWDKFPVIPDFDVLKWKRETQAEILRETKGMTREEIRAYFRQASERATIRRQELADRRAAENQT